MRWTCLPMGMLLVLLGCGAGPVTSSTGGDCNSHYLPVANAPTLHDLKRRLREDVEPSVRSLRVIDEHPDEGKVYVDLLNSRHRRVMALDMWQQDDGTDGPAVAAVHRLTSRHL